MLIKCRCGKNELEFKFLKAEDMPEGYEGECCAKAEVEPEGDSNPPQDPPVEPEGEPEPEKEPEAEAPAEEAEKPAEAPAEKKKPGRPKTKNADKA